MALLRIDAEGTRPVTADGKEPTEAIQAALNGLPRDRPVVIMIHGYKFCPDVPGRDPHSHILAMTPTCADRRAISWPAHLGFRREGAGLAIALGWESRGTIWTAARATKAAAEALVALVGLIRQHRADPVHIICHSLGAKVALQALCALPIGSVDKVILLAGAAFQGDAVRALQAPAGRTAVFLNVTSRENLVFDLLLAGILRGFARGSRSIGQGLAAPSVNWVDLRIDCSETRRHLASLGYRIARPARRVCHWSAYLRAGMFPIYRAVIEGRLEIGALSTQPSVSCPSGARTHVGGLIPPSEAPCLTPSPFTSGPRPMAAKSRSPWKKWACLTRRIGSISARAISLSQRS